LSVGESESLIEVWAVLETINGRSPVWILLLNHLVFFAAVETYFWVWNGLGLTIGEGESLIEVWAVRKGVN